MGYSGKGHDKIALEHGSSMLNDAWVLSLVLDHSGAALAVAVAARA
jgi:hypothetical protein